MADTLDAEMFVVSTVLFSSAAFGGRVIRKPAEVAMSAESPVLPELRLELVPPDVEAPLAVSLLLADRNRATILAILRDGPHCVCEMAAALDERSNNVSNHLARLREAGLVRASRQSADTRRMYYERDEAACAAAFAQLETVLAPKR